MDRTTDPFQVFYQQHVSWVAHRAALDVGENNAKDVAQEVLLRAYLAHARGEFDLSVPARAWLSITTRHVARDVRRRLLRERMAAQNEDIDTMDETLGGDPDRALVARRQWDELLELLDDLPPERRKVWVMTEYDKMSLADIAGELELPLGTVATRLRLARADLDAALRHKRAERKPSKASALLLLPLSAEAIGRTARSLPVPELPASTSEEIWRGIQDELHRRRTNPGGVAVDNGGSAPEPPPRRRNERLKLAASHFAAMVVGLVFGLFASIGPADTPGGRRASADPPQEHVAPTPVPVALPRPVVADSSDAVPTESAPIPPTSASDPEIAEQSLIDDAWQALRPPAPDPKKALRILDLYGWKYPHSTRFSDEISRLRREAERLAKKK